MQKFDKPQLFFDGFKIYLYEHGNLYGDIKSDNYYINRWGCVRNVSLSFLKRNMHLIGDL